MAKWKSGARGGRPDRGGGKGGQGRGNNGRGRAGAGWAPGRGRGHSHSGFNGSMQDKLDLDLDFTLQTFADARLPIEPVAGPSTRGRGTPAFRGRGRGAPFIPTQLPPNITFPGRGRGFDIPRRQVQGIGAPKGARRVPVPVGAKQTLSSLLHQERPLLKPIMFVPSTEARFLFQNEEELLQSIVEDLDDTLQSHIPTADRVTRVFSGGNLPPDNDEDGVEDTLEVVDFNDVGKLFDPTATTSNMAIPKSKTTLVPMENATVHENLNTRNETRPLPAEFGSLTEIVDKPLSAPNGAGINGTHLFYVDTQLRNIPNGIEYLTIQQPSSVLPGDGDDIIVYDAPHPRNTLRTSGRDKESAEDVTEISTINDHRRTAVDISRFSSYEHPPALRTFESHTISIPGEEPSSSVGRPTLTNIPEQPSSSTSTLDTTDTTVVAAGDNTASTRLRVPPITTPRQAKLWKSKLGRASKGMRTSMYPRNTPFSYMREEDLLRGLDLERDERHNERRRGDSDLDWGDTTDDGGEDIVGVGKEVVDTNAQEQEQELDADMKRVLGMLEKGKGRENLNQVGNGVNDNHGMAVDVDVDIATMERFAKGLLGADAGTYVTMDDICEKFIRLDDEGDEDVVRGSSGDENNENEGTVDEEEEEALKVEEAKFIQDGDPGNLDGDDEEETDGLGEEDDDDDEDEDDPDDEDEDEGDYGDSSFQFKLDRMRSMGGATVNGNEDDLVERNMTWAARDEAFIQHFNEILDEKEDITTNDRKHNTSLGDDFEFLNWSSSPAGGKYMVIPPELSIQYEMDRRKKAERKRAQALARIADPPSKKKKKGVKKGRKGMPAADPTIIALPNRVADMTTVVQIIRRFIADMGGSSSKSLPPLDKETRKNIHEIAAAFSLKSVSKGKGDARYITLTKTTKTGIQVNEGKIAKIIRRGGGVLRVPRQREGDVVGMAAPKLDGSNVGFRLLELMGWSEGDRIGASTNGLEAPLAAIIKTSKLGLGARK